MGKEYNRDVVKSPQSFENLFKKIKKLYRYTNILKIIVSYFFQIIIVILLISKSFHIVVDEFEQRIVVEQ